MEIFIGGLDKDVKEEDVRKVFVEVGEIVDLRVVMNVKIGKNKGFVFLWYVLVVDVKWVLEKFVKVEVFVIVFFVYMFFFEYFLFFVRMLKFFICY